MCTSEESNGATFCFIQHFVVSLVVLCVGFAAFFRAMVSGVFLSIKSKQERVCSEFSHKYSEKISHFRHACVCFCACI